MKTRNIIAEVHVNYVPKIEKKVQIKSSKDAEEIFRSVWNNQMAYRESMYVLLLNRANYVLGYNKLSEGGTCSTILDIKMLLQLLVKTNTHGFILCHNHPSGNINASNEDLAITNKVKAAVKLFEVQLLDHLILIEGDGYLSMADEGVI